MVFDALQFYMLKFRKCVLELLELGNILLVGHKCEELSPPPIIEQYFLTTAAGPRVDIGV